MLLCLGPLGTVTHAPPLLSGSLTNLLERLPLALAVGGIRLLVIVPWLPLLTSFQPLLHTLPVTFAQLLGNLTAQAAALSLHGGIGDLRQRLAIYAPGLITPVVHTFTQARIRQRTIHGDCPAFPD